MKRGVLTSSLAVALLVASQATPSRSQPPQRAKPQIPAKKTGNGQSASAQVVRIYVGSLSSIKPRRPSASLAAALAQHPKSSEFVVWWDNNAPGSSDVCSVRYHRRSRALELDRSTYDTRVDAASKAEVEATSDESWNYTGVTEEILQRLARKNANNSGGDDAPVGYFTQLAQLGAKGRKTQNVHHQNRKKPSA